MMLTSAALLLAATPTLAQGTNAFEGARFGLEYDHYDDGEGFTISAVEASADASFRFSGGFGFQLGLGYLKETDSSDEYLDLENQKVGELHAFYDVTPELRLGGLLAYDSYNDGDYLYALEGIYATAPLRLEARIGKFDSDFEPAMLYELHASYEVIENARLRGMARSVNYEDGFGHYQVFSLGGSYDVLENIRLYGDYGWNENDFGDGYVLNGSLVTLGVTIGLGGPINDKQFTYSPFY